MTAEPSHPPADPLGPEEGGGPPVGLPWTLVVEPEGWSADLEHAAPLPRVGEEIEYIGLDGGRRHLRVRQVVHTLQASSSDRPPVAAEERGPNTTVDGAPPDAAPRGLRSGLPRVFAHPVEPE